MTFGGFMPSARDRAVRLAQTMAAERACERLIVGYAHAVDFGRVDSAVSMFTPQAIFEVLGTTLSGRDEMKASLERLIGRHPVTRHSISSVATHPREDGTGDGIAYLTLHADSPDPLLIGHMRDQFVVEDGVWLIERRRIEVIYVDPDLGWP